jgi:hypothetical protein
MIGRDGEWFPEGMKLTMTGSFFRPGTNNHTATPTSGSASGPDLLCGGAGKVLNGKSLQFK